ncbi:hypothetical protein FO519_002562, partial [Halicephalobus sp. NKZ332]
ISQEDNRILVIEQSGRFDLQKMMKSIRTTPFMLNRFRNMERVLNQIGFEEKKEGKMSSAVLVIDLEGLNFQPNLIGFISGSYRILWGTLIEQYPYLISQILILNTPTFMNLLWNACSTFIPAEYRKKIQFLGSDWEKEIHSYLPASCLPQMYSGSLPDSLVRLPTSCEISIPKAELSFDEVLLESVIVPAGGIVVHVFQFNENEEIEFFMKHEQEFTMNMFFDEKKKTIQKFEDSEEMLEVYAGCERPGIPTLDHWKLRAPKTGFYHVIYGNEKAWIMSVNFKFQIFRNQAGMKIKPSSSSITSFFTNASSSSSNRSTQSKQKKIETFNFDSDEVEVVEPPSKKQKPSVSTSVTRTSPRKLSTGQLISETISLSSQRTSPRKKQKERPTTPVPESHLKDSRRSTAAASQKSDILNESIPEEEDGIMEIDPETRTGSKRRPSKVLVDEALHRVKKMKIAAPLNETDAIDLNCTVSIRTSQISGKRFKKQGKSVFGGPTQRISSQHMVIFENKSS